MTSPDDPLHPESEITQLRPGDSILSNAVWSTFFLIVSKVLRFIAIAYCVRRLGIYSWGQIAATLVTVGFLFFAVDQGLGTAPTLHKVGDKGIDGVFLRRIGIYRLAMALLVILAIHLFDLWVAPVDPLVRLYSFALAPRALTLDWWFQRREKFHLLSGMAGFRILLFLLGALLFVKPGDSPSIVLYLELAVEAVGCLIGYLFYLRLSERAVPSPIDSRAGALGYAHLVKIAFPYFIIGVLNTIHQSVDVVFLKHMCGYEEVGEYDMGYRIGVFLFFTGAGLVQILRPKLARLHGEGRSGPISDILVSSSKLLAALGCGFMIASLFFADAILALVFKQSGELTRFVFQWAPVWVAIAFMTILCADTLLSLGQKRRYVRGAFYCAFANVAANYALIRFFGAHGAIFATIFAEAVFFAYTCAWLPGALRTALLRNLVPQASAMAAILLIFSASRHADSRIPFLLGSLAVLAALIAFQGTLKKGTLAILARH